MLEPIWYRGVLVKRCSCCKAEKAPEAFYVNHRYADGLSSRCRACNNGASATRRETEDKSAKNAYQNEWRKKNPDKYRAQKRRQIEYERRVRAETRALSVLKQAA